MNDVLDKMLEKAKAIQQRAYAPYSNFSVGACICTENDNFYAGTNVENASYGLASCAEANAIGTMVAAGETRIKSILVIGTGEILCTPCGACRQRIREFSDDTTLIYMADQNGNITQKTLAELLPLPFGSQIRKKEE